MDTNQTIKPIPRAIHSVLQTVLKQGKSVLLLGPRQTGKSTLIKNFASDLFINFLLPSERIRFEKNPEILLGEIEFLQSNKPKPLVILDEVQKVPALMDI